MPNAEKKSTIKTKVSKVLEKQNIYLGIKARNLLQNQPSTVLKYTIGINRSKFDKMIMLHLPKGKGIPSSAEIVAAKSSCKHE